MENGEIRIVQYEHPPMWMEWGAYLGAVGLFVATLLYPATPIWPALLTGFLLYWNYRLFGVIKAYVNYVNTTEFSKLLTILSEAELNKQKDGTFQDSECLNKETGDEEDPDG